MYSQTNVVVGERRMNRQLSETGEMLVCARGCVCVGGGMNVRRIPLPLAAEDDDANMPNENMERLCRPPPPVVAAAASSPCGEEVCPRLNMVRMM